MLRSFTDSGFNQRHCSFNPGYCILPAMPITTLPGDTALLPSMNSHTQLSFWTLEISYTVILILGIYWLKLSQKISRKIPTNLSFNRTVKIDPSVLYQCADFSYTWCAKDPGYILQVQYFYPGFLWVVYKWEFWDIFIQRLKIPDFQWISSLFPRVWNLWLLPSQMYAFISVNNINKISLSKRVIKVSMLKIIRRHNLRYKSGMPWSCNEF